MRRLYGLSLFSFTNWFLVDAVVLFAYSMWSYLYPNDFLSDITPNFEKMRCLTYSWWGLRQKYFLLGRAEMPIFSGWVEHDKTLFLIIWIFEKISGSPFRRLQKPKGVYPGETPGTGPGPKCTGMYMSLVMHVHLLFLFCKKLSGAL